jgi:adenosylcobyric acid synthase
MHGTLALLDAADQALMAGFVVNKFRGDVGLLRPGLDTLERLTGRPVHGVLPWLRDLWLDGEDALMVRDRPAPAPGGPDRLKVAVVVLPRISNFTDVDALCLEPDLDVAFVDSPRALAAADVVVLPGTRATLADLAWLRERGLADAVAGHARAGGAVLGICGGFQMLGSVVEDPDGVEGPAGTTAPGLGLLDVRTVFGRDKVLRLPQGQWRGLPVTGYEIHHGRVHRAGGEEFLGGARAGAVFGTLWHGALEGDAFRGAWLCEVAGLLGREVAPGGLCFAAVRDARIDLLADAVEEHLDVDRLLALAEQGAPAGLPVVRGGLAMS